MAEIVQSLFGVSPEMYQRQQQDRADAQALRFAQLDPFQQANYAIGRGANMLGGAIGGALGGQDPELQRITMRQQIARQLNPGDPTSIQQAIAALSQAGDAEGAMMLQGEYRKLQESGALIGQRTAAAQASLAQATREREPRAAPTTNELTNARAIAAAAGPEGSPEYNAAFNAEYQRLTAPKEGATKTQVVETTGGQLLVDMGTGQTIANLGAAPDRRNIATTNVNVSGTAENEYAKVAGKSTAERDINLIESAQSVATTLPKMYETRQLLESGNLNTGIGAEIQQVIDRTRSKFLNDKRAGRVVNDTEYLNALLGSDVFPQISALGIGARGLDTPAEREFLRQVITGTISMDRETLKRMTDFRIRSAERAVEKYNEQLGAGEFKQYQTVTGRTLNPIRTRTPPARQGDGTPSAAPAAPAGNIDALLRKYQ
jgi:hypothetical protein